MSKRQQQQMSQWLSRTLDEAFAKDKGLWADSLLDALQGLTAEQAAWRPKADVCSIWEIVNHVAYWKDIAIRRLDGQNTPTYDPARDGDWPKVGTLTEIAWAETVADLKNRQAELEKRVRALSDADLQRPWSGDSNAGETILGLVAHDCYHTGEIVKLRQSQGI